MTILLKTDTSKRRTRRSAEEEDRMDAQEDAFHKAVMDGYMELAKQYPERIVVIDGEQSIAEIAEKIKSLIDDMMKKRGII
jgi:dTMP kinase